MLIVGSNNQTKSVHLCARIRRRFQNGVSLDSRPRQRISDGRRENITNTRIWSWNSFFKYHKHASAQHQSQLFSVKTSALLDLPGIENSIIFNWQHKKTKINAGEHTSKQFVPHTVETVTNCLPSYESKTTPFAFMMLMASENYPSNGLHLQSDSPIHPG